MDKPTEVLYLWLKEEISTKVASLRLINLIEQGFDSSYIKFSKEIEDMVRKEMKRRKKKIN